MTSFAGTLVTDGTYLYTFFGASPFTIAYTPVAGGVTTTITSAGNFGTMSGSAGVAVSGHYLVFLNTTGSANVIAAVAVP